MSTAIVLDIEGTTSPTASVRDTLYDYTRRHIGQWLAEMLRQPLPDQPGHQVRRAAAAEAFNDAHRPGRIIRRRGAAPWRRGKRGGARAREAQQVSTLHRHFHPALYGAASSSL